MSARCAEAQEVIDYVLGLAETRELLEHLGGLLRYLIPKYVKEGKAYLTIAVGCTGGKHRSVAAAESAAQMLSARGWPARVVHRDIDKE